MFKKTWKQIKIFVFILIILFSIPKSILPKSSQQENIDYYLDLNDSETRMPDYKDDRTALELKLNQLEIINRSRKRFGVKPLKLDILASRVANKISREAAENNFAGHWNLRGEKPYHRYAFAGGYDHVSENAYAEWSSENLSDTPESIALMMKHGHDSFITEKAPNDGHKQTVIAKDHNYVGLGYHVSGKQFRYYEEYIDRYFEFSGIPTEVKPGEKTAITVKTDGKSFLYYMIVHYEKFPQPMTAKEISGRGSYSDYTGEQYQQVYSWDLAKFREGTNYKIPLSFSKEGLYYIHLYSDKKEYTEPTRLTTKGKTPHSGIVIQVRK
jgi:uncharacterized protein YkwD